MALDEVRSSFPSIAVCYTRNVDGKVTYTDYRNAARAFHRSVKSFPGVAVYEKGLGTDECYADVTAEVARRVQAGGDASKASNARPMAAAVRQLCHDVREAVMRGAGLQCSVGAAPNKLLSKLASKLAKPPRSGVHVIDAADVPKLLTDTPAKSLPGCGRMEQFFEERGVSSAADLQRVSREDLQRQLGPKGAAHVWLACRGKMTKEDEAVVDRGPPKTIQSQMAPPVAGLIPPWSMHCVRRLVRGVAKELIERVDEDAEDNNRHPTQVIVGLHCIVFPPKGTPTSRVDIRAAGGRFIMGLNDDDDLPSQTKRARVADDADTSVPTLEFPRPLSALNRGGRHISRSFPFPGGALAPSAGVAARTACLIDFMCTAYQDIVVDVLRQDNWLWRGGFLDNPHSDGKDVGHNLKSLPVSAYRIIGTAAQFHRGLYQGLRSFFAPEAPAVAPTVDAAPAVEEADAADARAAAEAAAVNISDAEADDGPEADGLPGDDSVVDLVSSGAVSPSFRRTAARKRKRRLAAASRKARAPPEVPAFSACLPYLTDPAEIRKFFSRFNLVPLPGLAKPSDDAQ